jgi:isoleucyl-tRNA synthetase
MCQVHDQVSAAYEGYRFNVVFRTLYDYVIGDLSNGYLNATKDRVYCGAANGFERRSALTVWAQLLSMLVHDLQPILVYTTDEVMSHLPASLRDGQTYAALLDWYEAPLSPADYEPLLAAYEAMVDARAAFTKSYEEALANGTVAEKTPQAARATLAAPEETLEVLRASGVDLAEPFVCSEVELVGGAELSCVVEAAHGEKCPRCWNWRELGADGLCARCHDAVAACADGE